LQKAAVNVRGRIELPLQLQRYGFAELRGGIIRVAIERLFERLQLHFVVV
jgi:hypothetical protein